MKSLHFITHEVTALKSVGAAGRTLLPKGSLYAMRAGFALTEDDWVFAGVASTPDLDLVGEVVYPESFEKSLQEFVNTGNVFYEHMYKDPSKVPPGSMLDQRLALPVMAEIHDGALWVYGVFDREHPKAQEVWKALNRKDERFATKSIGLSIGARPQGRSTMTQLPDGRMAKKLPDLQLYEVSFTYQPVNQYTWAMALKSMLAGADMPDQTQDAPDAKGPGDASAPTDNNPDTVEAPMAGGGENPADPQPGAGDPSAGAAPSGAPGAPGADPAAGGAAPGTPAPGADPAAGGAPAGAPGQAAPGSPDPAAGAGADAAPAAPGDPNAQGASLGDLFGQGDGQGGDKSGGEDGDQSMGLVLDKVDNQGELLQTILGIVQALQAKGDGQGGNTDPTLTDPTQDAGDQNAIKSLFTHKTEELKDFIQTQNELIVEQFSLVKSLSAQLTAQGELLASYRAELLTLREDVAGVQKSLRSSVPVGEPNGLPGVSQRPAQASGNPLEDVFKSIQGSGKVDTGNVVMQDLVTNCRTYDEALKLPSAHNQARTRESVIERMHQTHGLSRAQTVDLFNRLRARNLT